MAEIDYRVVRSILSARSFTPIVQNEIPDNLLQMDRAPETQKPSPIASTPAPAVFASGREDGIRVIQTNSAPSAQYTGVGRNEPCPCGSGKKFKHCHGK